MNKTTITIVVIVLVVLAGIGGYFLNQSFSDKNVTDNQGVATTTQPSNNEPVVVTPPVVIKDTGQTVIGKSVEGRDIIAYHYGKGDTELLFVGGIHGGYEWNTVLVAYELMDYLQQNSSTLPANIKVTVMPVLNPDGLYKTVGTATRFTPADVPASQDKQVAGRFNSNNVDLNRNFDCDWQTEGKWQDKTVSGGSSAFSEPESQAFKSYMETNKPTAVVVWYSSANGVFASSCHNGVSAETNTLTRKYADASGYPAYQDFNFYEITGDMVNWLARTNVPAISVLLKNHTDTEWTKNLAGIKALFKYYAK